MEMGHSCREFWSGRNVNVLLSIVLAILLLVWAMAPAWVAAQEGEGVIQGRVLQGTPGGSTDFAALSVTVFPFVGETSLEPITVTTRADGTFEVANLPTGEDRSYGLRVEYAGVEYFYPELITFGAGTTVEAEVTVYETTSDDTAIHVVRHHVIIDFAEGTMQVAEMYIFQNPGDRTFVGSGETLRFPLPAGAMELRFEDPRMRTSTRLAEGNVVVDTLPVPPGMRQVLFSYALPYQGSSATFEKEILYPTANLNILVADVGVKVGAEGFTAGEPITTRGEARFLNYTRSDVTAGSRLRLTFSNLPRGAGAAAGVVPDRSATLRWLGIGLTIVALAFGVAYPVLRSRLLHGAGGSEELSLLRRRRQVLLQEIADLDDVFEAGGMDEAEYRDARAALKAELIEIMWQLREEERQS